MLDIFNSDAFSVTTLSIAMQDRKPRPSRIGDLGLFSSEGVTTTSISIEKIGDMLQLVSPSARGGPGETREMPKRNLRSVNIPHFQRDWSIGADEVQGVRAFGSTTAVETIAQKVADRIEAQVQDLDLTDEYSRIGALHGVVTYKDSTYLDLYDLFGVSQATEVDFDLDNASPTEGALLLKCVGIIRAMRAALGGISFSYVHAFVGDTFFDQLLTHPDVRNSYKNTSQAAFLRDSYVGPNRGNNPIFEFGGIVWENYGAIESSGDGALMGIAATKARFIPMGVPGFFRTYYAPADYEETVNTVGLAQYAKQWPMPNGKGRLGEVQRNPLHLCTRPAALLRARNT